MDDEILIGLDLVGGKLFDGKEIRNFAFTFRILESFTMFRNNYEKFVALGRFAESESSLLCYHLGCVDIYAPNVKVYITQSIFTFTH